MPLFNWPTSGETRTKVITLPLIGLATTEQVITWTTPMPDANYGVQFSIEPGAASIGKVVAQVKQGTITPEGFTVLLTNSLLVTVAAGSKLHVTATQVND